MANHTLELEQAHILLSHKQAERIQQVSRSLAHLHDCEVRLTITGNVDDTVRELQRARFDLVLCDRRLLTARLIEQFNALRARGEAATIVLLSNEPDEQIRHAGRAIGALDAIPLAPLSEVALSHYIQLALQLGNTLQQDQYAGQVLNAVGNFGDVCFYRAHLDEHGAALAMHWLSPACADILGISSNELASGAGSDLRELLIDADRTAFDHWLETIRIQHSASAVLRLRDNAGQLRHLELQGQALCDSTQTTVTGVLGRVRNISGQQQLQQREEQLACHQKQLADFARACADALEPQDLIRSAPKLVAEAIGCDICGIFQRQPTQFALLGSHGWKLNTPDDRLLPHARNELNNELDFTLSRLEAVLIDNVAGEQRFTPSAILQANGAQAGICLPIVGQHSQGVLCAYYRDEFDPSEDDLRFLHTLVDIIASHLRPPATAPAVQAVQAPAVSGGAIEAGEASAADEASGAIHAACQLVLRTPRWQRCAENVLQRLGQACAASHALLYTQAGNALSLHYEWTEAGQRSYRDSADNEQLDIPALLPAALREPFASGEPVQVNAQQGAALTSALRGQSLSVVPVLLANQLWGCILLTHAEPPPPAQRQSLALLGSVLGASIQRQQLEARMDEITASGTLAGESYHACLARHLATALHADYCHIGRLAADGEQVQVIANWSRKGLGEPFGHRASDSACAPALQGQWVQHPERAASLHPNDRWLQQHHIHGYVAAPVRNRAGEIDGYVAIMRNHALALDENELHIVRLFANRVATEFERERMEAENRQLAAIPQDSPSPILRVNASGQPDYINPACQRLQAELQLDALDSLLPSQHHSLVEQALQQAGTTLSAEQTVAQRTFEWFYHAQPAQHDVQLYAVDISAHRDEEEQLRNDAFHDPLTGLPNRNFFKNLVSHSLEKSQQSAHYHFAILFLDLDRFKLINDSLGHEAGDRLLEAIATRLVDNVRPGDYVARFGGDEFAILLDGIGDVHAAGDIAGKIQHALQAPIQLGNHESFTSASIGIAYSDRNYQHIEDMIRDADSAMYHAKNNGKAQHVIFSSDMHEQAMFMLQLETDLRKSIENNALRIHYQPIIDLAHDQLVGFEALVRWQHPERGLMFPDEFIPLAEETGFVRQLDRWMLDQAAAQLQDWRSTYANTEKLQISLNLSGLHFDNMEILSHLGNLLNGNDLSGHLKLELTESVLMQNSARSLEMFNILHARGLGISIDDFGVGYSSLSRLKRLPIDALKIDRSFVQHMQTDRASLDIIRAIIDLAYNLKMEVVAEGVETAQQYKLLKRLGCHYAQGYYLSRPLPADRAAQFIHQPLNLGKR